MFSLGRSAQDFRVAPGIAVGALVVIVGTCGCPPRFRQAASRNLSQNAEEPDQDDHAEDVRDDNVGVNDVHDYAVENDHDDDDGGCGDDDSDDSDNDLK